jgi:uncharacterized membrane protein YtjA (UPF0391 family)
LVAALLDFGGIAGITAGIAPTLFIVSPARFIIEVAGGRRAPGSARLAVRLDSCLISAPRMEK